MRSNRKARAARALAPLLLGSLVSCATGMNMTADDLRDVGPEEGLVLGSFKVEGGDDFLGRKRWELLAREAGGGFHLTGPGDYTIEADRDADEVVFLTKMPAGDYHFYRLIQPGFSSFEADIDVPFRVQPGKTVYLGRLVLRFPSGQITAFTMVGFDVENDKFAAVATAEREHGIPLDDVVTDLMGPN